jgi:predicted RNA-binding protein with PIN domain
VEPGLVRAALERALEVARQGEAANPPVAPPKELAPYLSFQKLSGPALAAVWRVLDTDEDFRARVVDETPPDAVDAAGWLALCRPPGWEAAVEAIGRTKGARAVSEEAEKRLRDLQRSLATSETKRQHAEAEVARQREEVDAAHEEVTSLRRDRRRAEDAAKAAERRVEELEQKLGDRETRLAETQGAREAREHELTETRRLLAEAQAEVARRPEPLVPGERPVDPAALRDATNRLQRAAATLARTVEGLAEVVPPVPVVLEEEVAAGPTRTVLVLPGGVVADSPEGGRWLLGRPKVVLLVDGYNVAKTAWPDLGLEEQRSRLVRALDGLVARSGASAEVVFDGPEEAVVTGRQGTPSVNVRYSGGELADDVVVGLVDAFPPDRPVVVVSNDREVRDAARGRAANVIGSDTLIALLGG